MLLLCLKLVIVRLELFLVVFFDHFQFLYSLPGHLFVLFAFLLVLLLVKDSYLPEELIAIIVLFELVFGFDLDFDVKVVIDRVCLTGIHLDQLFWLDLWNAYILVPILAFESVQVHADHEHQHSQSYPYFSVTIANLFLIISIEKWFLKFKTLFSLIGWLVRGNLLIWLLLDLGLCFTDLHKTPKRLFAIATKFLLSQHSIFGL